MKINRRQVITVIAVLAGWSIMAVLFTPQQAPLVLFSMYLMSFAVTFLSALLFKSQFHSNEPFILELPPYRFPTPRQIVLRGWQEGSGLLDGYPGLRAYIARGEARPAYQRAFADQLAVFTDGAPSA